MLGKRRRVDEGSADEADAASGATALAAYATVRAATGGGSGAAPQRSFTHVPSLDMQPAGVTGGRWANVYQKPGGTAKAAPEVIVITDDVNEVEDIVQPRPALQQAAQATVTQHKHEPSLPLAASTSMTAPAAPAPAKSPAKRPGSELLLPHNSPPAAVQPAAQPSKAVETSRTAQQATVGAGTGRPVQPGVRSSLSRGGLPMATRDVKPHHLPFKSASAPSQLGSTVPLAGGSLATDVSESAGGAVEPGASTGMASAGAPSPGASMQQRSEGRVEYPLSGRSTRILGHVLHPADRALCEPIQVNEMYKAMLTAFNVRKAAVNRGRGRLRGRGHAVLHEVSGMHALQELVQVMPEGWMGGDKRTIQGTLDDLRAQIIHCVLTAVAKKLGKPRQDLNLPSDVIMNMPEDLDLCEHLEEYTVEEQHGLPGLVGQRDVRTRAGLRQFQLLGPYGGYQMLQHRYEAFEGRPPSILMSQMLDALTATGMAGESSTQRVQDLLDQLRYVSAPLAEQVGAVLLAGDQAGLRRLMLEELRYREAQCQVEVDPSLDDDARLLKCRLSLDSQQWYLECESYGADAIGAGDVRSRQHHLSMLVEEAGIVAEGLTDSSNLVIAALPPPRGMGNLLCRVNDPADVLPDVERPETLNQYGSQQGNTCMFVALFAGWPFNFMATTQSVEAMGRITYPYLAPYWLAHHKLKRQVEEAKSMLLNTTEILQEKAEAQRMLHTERSTHNRSHTLSGQHAPPAGSVAAPAPKGQRSNSKSQRVGDTKGSGQCDFSPVRQGMSQQQGTGVCVAAESDIQSPPAAHGDGARHGAGADAPLHTAVRVGNIATQPATSSCCGSQGGTQADAADGPAEPTKSNSTDSLGPITVWQPPTRPAPGPGTSAPLLPQPWLGHASSMPGMLMGAMWGMQHQLPVQQPMGWPMQMAQGQMWPPGGPYPFMPPGTGHAQSGIQNVVGGGMGQPGASQPQASATGMSLQHAAHIWQIQAAMGMGGPHSGGMGVPSHIHIQPPLRQPPAPATGSSPLNQGTVQLPPYICPPAGQGNKEMAPPPAAAPAQASAQPAVSSVRSGAGAASKTAASSSQGNSAPHGLHEGKDAHPQQAAQTNKQLGRTGLTRKPPKPPVVIDLTV